MSGVALYDYQQDAVDRMRNGCILCGGVGSGKSRTGLAYYYIKNGGKVNTKRYVKMHDPPQDLYIITTARKRDTAEWEEEMLPFMMTTDEKVTMYHHKVVVDAPDEKSFTFGDSTDALSTMQANNYGTAGKAWNAIQTTIRYVKSGG